MNTHALLHAYVLDGLGSARALTFEEIPNQLSDNESLWLHWAMHHEDTKKWLYQHSPLNEFDCDILLDENMRPRLIQRNEEEILVFLRTINNPALNADSDLLPLRLCLLPDCLISLRDARTGFAEQLIEAFKAGKGPKNANELLLFFANASTDNIEEKINQLVDFVDEQEEKIDTDAGFVINHKEMIEARRAAANLRKILAPERDMFTQLAQKQDAWYSLGLIRHWSELSNNLTRFVEELELSRERVGFILETERRQREERTGRIMFYLTVITGFFLPLSFFTGLLGINVGGIPLAENSYGFFIVCALLLGVMVIQLVLLRWLRWL
ncbi:CorA family divalent cation transporter [Pseudomonas sp. F1_0610]|uniref:CorA family divalent cation transporter n=1 Tax=Pseudomonas sp. F1_0610 TaxID=3114284 RepID=UPI0039C2CF1B